MNTIASPQNIHRVNTDKSIELPLITQSSLHDIQRETKRLIIPSSIPRGQYKKKLNINIRNNLTYFNSPLPEKVYLSAVNIGKYTINTTQAITYDSYNSNLSEYLNYNFPMSNTIDKYDRTEIVNKIKIIEEDHTSEYSKKFKNSEKSIVIKIKSFSLRFYKDNNEVNHLMLPFHFILIFSLLSVENILKTLIYCFSNGLFRINNLEDILENIKCEKFDIYDFNKNIKFMWIKDQVIYEVILSRPIAIFNIKHKQIFFRKYLEKEFLLNLCMKNFNNWEDILLSDFIQTKDFRIFFNNLLSKNSNLFSRNITIDKAVDIICHSEHDYHLFGIITENTKNLFFKFYGFTIKHIFDSSSKIDFSWKHTITMLKLSNIVNLSSFINRRTTLSTGSTNFVFNKKLLDSINCENILLLKSNESNVIKIINPHLEWQYMLNGAKIKGKADFNDNLLKFISTIKNIPDVYNFLNNSINQILSISESSII
jgi:hypothetical protein